MLTKEEIAEFKRLTLEIYGIKLTDSEALDQGSRLIMLFELMFKHRTKPKMEAMNSQKKVVQNNG